MLDEPAISRVHLEVRPVDGGWEILDLGSSSGTRVNGARVSRHRLREGDRIQVGGIGLVAKGVGTLPRAGGPSRTAVLGSAIAFAAALIVLVAGGVLVVRNRARLPELVTQRAPRHAPVPPEPRRTDPVSQEAVRALLEPTLNGVPRLTPLGTVTAVSGTTRFQHESIGLELPPGAIPAGSAVTVSRVDAVPAAMRESYPRARFGKAIPIAPIFQVDTVSHPLGKPATVSVPLADATGLEGFTVLSWDPKTQAWDSVPARYDAGSRHVIAEVAHFSLIEVVALVAIGGTVVVGWLIDGDWISSASCFDTMGGHFSVCYMSDTGALKSYTSPGKGFISVPAIAVDAADALEKAHATYEGAELKVPTSKTWVYVKPSDKEDALFVGGGFASPHIYINQKGSAELVKASAAHEYFHYVQYLMVGSRLSTWWKEASAVGVETALYPSSLEWVKEYFAVSKSGTKELDKSLGSEEDAKYGYRVALFAAFLTRTRGGLAFHRHVLERHSFEAILPSLAFALGGEDELRKGWLEYGRSLIGPDWGQYLTEAEHRQIAREFDVESLRLDPLKGTVDHARPETPLSTRLYDVRVLRSRIPQNRTFKGPVLVRLKSDGESRAFHVMLPEANSQQAAGNLTTRPVTASITPKDPAVEVFRLTSKRENVVVDLVGWLVDGETQPSGNAPEVRITWLLPPEGLRYDEARKRLVWDAHPLAATGAKPAAPWSGYGVYRLLKEGDGPELLDVALEPEYPIKAPDELCARFAVTARLQEKAVRGTWESDRTEWVSPGLPEPKDFTLEGKLSPLSDTAAKMVDVTAREARFGIRGLEIEATVAGETKALYKKERTAERQSPGAYQPEDVVTFRLPPPGTPYKVVARAWILPRDHRCFDPARHLLEKVIAEEKGSGPEVAGEGRVVEQDTRSFHGPRSAIEVGIGKAACIGTAPNNLGLRTELTFTEFPKAEELALDGTITLDLKTRTEPNAPFLYAFYSRDGLVTSQKNGVAFWGISEGFLYPSSKTEKPHPFEKRRPTDSAEWTFGGVMNFDKAANRGGPVLVIQCQSGEPLKAMESTTVVNVRWKYPVDSVYLPKGAAGPAPPLSSFAFGGRYRVQYVVGDSKAVFVEHVERDANGRLKTFQPASAVTGRTEDRQERLPRMDGVLGADGSFTYTHRMWGQKRLGDPAVEQPGDSGSGRVTIVDGRTFRIDATLRGKLMAVTYTRLP